MRRDECRRSNRLRRRHRAANPVAQTSARRAGELIGLCLTALSAIGCGADTAGHTEASAGGQTRGVGSRIEAEALNERRSTNYAIAVAETAPDVRYVGNVDSDSALCYDDIDLTGVRSIELEYARGSDEPGRFAILVSAGDGLGPEDESRGEEHHVHRRMGELPFPSRRPVTAGDGSAFAVFLRSRTAAESSIWTASR